MAQTPTRFQRYPIETPTAICVGFTVNDRYYDTLVQLKEGENDDYYINKAAERLKPVLDMALKMPKISLPY